jgi:hypothetical protein
MEKWRNMKLDIYANPHWLLSANQENFELSMRYRQVWGVQDKWYPQLKALEKGDIVFFYISNKIKKVIGVGEIGNKFIQREPLWPDEIEENRVKYPLRFEFTIKYLLNEKDWTASGIDIIDYINKNFGKGIFADLFRGGINFIRYTEIIDFLYKEFKRKFNYTIQLEKQYVEFKEEKEPGKDTLHNYLKDLIYRIGIMNKLISQKECSVDNMLLDVVWRRIEKGSPTYVFEIQVGGDIYHAISKLKHAFDLWNSNIFLVIYSPEDRTKAHQLLSGTFHEIKDKVKIISSKDIEELFERKKSWIELEKKLGIL